MAFNFSYLKSWGISTLICFFLYDLMWIFLDFSGFKEIFDGHYTCLFVDFAYCAIFSFSSLLVSQKILKWKIINYRGDYHLKMFLIGIILLFANLLIAGLCEIFRLIVDTDFSALRLKKLILDIDDTFTDRKFRLGHIMIVGQFFCY